MSVRLTNIAPELDLQMMEKLVKASQFQWRTLENKASEADVFNKLYNSIAKYYYGVAGKAALDIFETYRPLAEAFVKHCLMSDDVPGEPLRAMLVGETARGNTQATIRPITLQSFSNAKYIHIADTTGSYDLIPNGSGVETANSKEQGWLILGWYDALANTIIPYDMIQTNISDNIGVRRPLYLKGKDIGMTHENLAVFPEHCPKIVEPGNTLDVNINVTVAGVKFALWPLGIEVIRADSPKMKGPLDS